MSNVKPKKYLGQHFLLDHNIASKIVSTLKNEQEGTVIEIGPGTGILTKFLLELYPDFKAFDVDIESIGYLKNEYPDDAHKFLLSDYLKYDLNSSHVSIIGNFPYHISSQLLFKIWEDRNKVDEVVCMVQKEVADRIYAPPGNKIYGILTVLLRAFYEIEYLFKVSPSVFNPPPKVQSAVIRLKRNDVFRLACDEHLFKQIVKAGFGKRRKMLRNALKSLNLPSLENAKEMLNKRAEQLSVPDFISLTNKVTV